jgi:hypothetical protein
MLWSGMSDSALKEGFDEQPFRHALAVEIETCDSRERCTHPSDCSYSPMQ